MNILKKAGILLFVITSLFYQSCDVTRKFLPGEYLLIKNEFRIDNKRINQDELSGYLQQYPNQKLFGLIRPGVALYHAGSEGKNTKFKTWIRTKLGAPPVKLDTNLNIIARKQMTIYLANKGYFHSEISDSVVYKNKKAKVIYFINTNVPYTVRNLTYVIPDSSLSRYVMLDTSKSLIKTGKNYDSYILADERTRISANLTNYGYYRFSSSYIIFHIDSAHSSRQLDISLEIKNTSSGNHHRYFFNKIYIYPEFELLQSDTLALDTIMRTFENAGRDTTWNTYYFLYRNKFTVRPRTITQAILISTGKPFNLPDINATYTNLSALQVFKFVNIQFHEVLGQDSSMPRLLDCRIQLSRSLSQTFSVATDGTNSSGAFGVQGNFSSQHRNVFGGAQLLRLNLTASAQMQGNLGSSIGNNLLNTIDLGANANISFPQFLIPIKPERFAKTYRPRTSISAGYNYQRQPDYDRHITNIAFGYNWNQSPFVRHILNPAEISFVKIYPDSSFQVKLDKSFDRRLKNQYTDHMVAGLKYTITYSSQNVTTLKDFIYLRSNVETGGNLLSVANYLLKSKKNSNGSYYLFGIPYSQYLKPDLDFRYYHLITQTRSWVARFYGGIGIPYWNSSTLPFEKAFFAGGSNDLRGWKMGSLGPGSYHNDSIISFDQTGDMQLQVNFEYRFPVYSFIRSAFFVDAGNVWLLNENPDYPGGKFKVNTFIKQVAIDVGIGIRADFDFFIFRLDPAFPIRVPWSESKGYWYINKLQLKDIVWNFGIGYPF